MGSNKLWTLCALLAVSLLALVASFRPSHDGGRREPNALPAVSVALPEPTERRAPASNAVPAEIRGIVLGSTGAGARASILAVKSGAPPSEAPRWAADSGADGRFVIAGVEPGHYEIWAWSTEGYGASGSCEVGRGPVSVELRLEESGAPTHGIVRDTAGGTVASAELRVMHVNAGLDRAVALARSDANGRYRLRLPPGNYLVRVSASGYALTQGVLGVGRQGAEQDFSLDPAAAISGRVVRDGGKAATDITVTLRPARLDTIQAQWPRAVPAQRDGAFGARDVPPGSYLLVAETHDESATFGPFQLDAGEERTGIELTLAAGQGLRVEVVTEGGSPIDGATVEVRQDRAGVPSRSVSARSDAHGVAEPGGLFSGDSTVLVVNHPDYEQRIEPVGVLSAQAEPRVSRVTLRRAARLVGRVLSATGKPVQGARVAVAAPSSAGGAYASTLSDEKGEFALRVGLGTEDGGRLVLEARHADEGVARLEVSDWARPFTLELSPGLYVNGAVRDEHGAAVPFARVAATQIEPRARGSEALDVADAEGVFHVGPFEPGLVSVELQGAVLAAPTSRARARVDLRSGRSGSVNLIAPVRQSRVRGRVLDEHEQPVAGATVLVSPERLGFASRTEGTPALTDARGAFDCEGLYAGPHRVFVEVLGYAPVERPVASPGTVDIALEPSSTAVAKAALSPAAPQPDQDD